MLTTATAAMDRYNAESAFFLLRRPEYRKPTPGDIKKTSAIQLRTKEVLPKSYEGLTSVEPFHRFAASKIKASKPTHYKAEQLNGRTRLSYIDHSIESGSFPAAVRR